MGEEMTETNRHVMFGSLNNAIYDEPKTEDCTSTNMSRNKME